MKKEMKKVPAVRFTGFTGDWEQRKLGEIADKVTSKNKEHRYKETLTNSAEQGIVSQKEYFDHSISNIENINGYYVVEDNDFVYNPRISTSAPVGPINRNKLGRTGVMSPLYTVFKPHEIDESYLEWFFKSSHWYKFMYLNGDTGARSDRFAIKDSVFFKMPISVPTFEEQYKVGDFLNEADHLLTLNQQKLDQLKKLKAYFLQNLFPAKGEKVPKIRFKGFTGDWEERKIGDCFDERKEGMPNGELLSVTINEGVKRFSELERHDSSNQDKSKYKKVCIGDIAYNSMRMWQGASGVSTYEGIVSPAYTILKPKNGINSKFVSYLFKKKDILYIFQVNSQGITSDNWNLKFPILSKISIRVPASIKEQNKIAKQMEKIDDIITLHQQKIAQFQAVKKFLLQNLFI